jgi:hypothetical protein
MIIMAIKHPQTYNISDRTLVVDETVISPWSIMASFALFTSTLAVD